MVKLKTFTTLGILTLLLLSLGIVSATTLEFVNIDSLPSNVTQGNEYTINFTLNNTVNATNYTLNWTLNKDYWTTLPSLEGINLSQNLPGSATITIPSDRTGTFEPELKLEFYNASNNLDNNTISTPFSTTIQEKQDTPSEGTTCQLEFETPETNELEITYFNVDNFGEGDDDAWYPLDEIEIELDVEAQEDNIDDVMVEIFVYLDGEDVTNDFDFQDEEIDLGNMDDGEEETAIFMINELPADLEENNNYELRFLVYSKKDKSICTSNIDGDNYFNFEVEREYDTAIFIRDGDIFTNIDAQAGDRLEVSFNVINIGSNKEDHVLVHVLNTDLGIDEFKHFRKMDSGEKKTTSFDLVIPEDAEEKTYRVKVITYYDYDDGDILERTSYDENSFDDLDEDYYFNLNIQEIPGLTNPTIDAALASSETMVGEELAVNVVITNNKAENSNVVISAEGYESWADSMEVSPQILTLEEGQTKQSTITLMPTQAGQQSFTIKIIQDGDEFVRTVAVSISEEPGLLGDLFEGTDNTLLYLIAGILVLLIILVIVLIVKVSKRPSTTEF